jgi:hypothetical protein
MVEKGLVGTDNAELLKKIQILFKLVFKVLEHNTPNGYQFSFFGFQLQYFR